MRLLVTSALTRDEGHLDELRRLGHDVVFMADEAAPLPAGAADVEGIVCNGLFLHHPHSAFQQLRFVQLSSAGLDRAPVQELAERGVELRSATGVYSIPVAEWAVTQVLQLCKSSREFWQQQQERRWVKDRDLPELAGSTVTIVGFGEIGREVAKRLRGFDVRVAAVNSRPTPSPLADLTFGTRDLGTALSIADVVIITLPLTPVTRHLIDAAALQQIKRNAVLVDVSRGGIIDETALVAALDEGRFRGVALDVFEQEPLPRDSRLWGFDRVVVSPHNAFASDAVADRLLRLVIRNLSEAESQLDRAPGGVPVDAVGVS